ncbi:MAG TPA: hypothetical protein VMJ72_02360 [Candidatus Paceibacterota bacterium]|nr:hypothetical protein [Candidatus Paceibacterota bacterium]
MDRFANLLDVSRLQQLTGVGDALREPRGLFVAMVLVVLVLYGLSVGRTKALVSLLSIYVAYSLTVLFPFLDVLSGRLTDQLRPVAAVLLFLATYLVVFLLLSHSAMRTRMTLGEISFLQVLLISVVQIGLLASISVSLVPPTLAEHTFGSLVPYLAGQRVLWAWAAAAVVLMPLMHAKSRD